jgi:uncharacterized protein (DUF1697 family)
MKSYVILLRGINVGGKNKVPMAALKECLEKRGFSNATTYIASGNVIVDSDKNVKEIKSGVEKALVDNFTLGSQLIKVLVLSRDQLESVVNNKPKGFGEKPDKYHSDAIFLIDIDSDVAMSVFDPKEGVDTVWPGVGVIYSQRLSALRTKSRLSKIMGTPAYKSMTIRTWGTTTRLLALLSARQEK